MDVCSVSCDAPLICAAGHCREQCTTNPSCPVGHMCMSGACQLALTSADDASMAEVDAGIPGRDGGDAGLACDPILNLGCTSGRCGLSGGTPTCIQTIGTGQLRAPCQSDADCGAQLSCQGARCVYMCQLNQEYACGADSACTNGSVHGEDTLPDANGIGLCSEHCDLVADTRCPTDSSCAFGTDRHGHDFTWCRDVPPLARPDGTCELEQECLERRTC